MIPVSSSRLSSIGFQPAEDGGLVGLLWVQFAGRDQTTGYYDAVPRDIFEGLRDSPSKGRFLKQYIIDMGYTFVPAPLPN